MQALKVRVERGKIVGDAPPGIPEGTVLELCLVEPEDEMSKEELAALREALDAGWQSMKEGRFRPAREVLADLRGKR